MSRRNRRDDTERGRRALAERRDRDRRRDRAYVEYIAGRDADDDLDTDLVPQDGESWSV